MDENRVSGTAKNIGGKLEEGFGRVTGDTKTQAAGVAKQASTESVEVFEGRGTLFGWPDFLKQAPVTPLKINTPEPPSEATVPLSAAFTSKG